MGSALATELKGHQVSQGRPQQLIEQIKSGKSFDYIINVGWFKTLQANSKILNRPGAVAHSSNKLRARELFRDKGIPAPDLWLDPKSIPDNAFPVVGRTTHHKKGQGFWFCKTKTEAIAAARPHVQVKRRLVKTRKGNKVWRSREVRTSGATHFLKFIPDTREFRIHVMAPCVDISNVTADEYVVLKISEKTASNPKADKIVKNHDNGWVFGHPADSNSEKLKEARNIARKVVRELGLHWGAVDIMLSNNKLYVLEVNSTPCLTDDQANTLEKYAGGMKSLLGAAAPLRRKHSKEEIYKGKQTRKDKLKSFLSKQNF